MELVQWFLRSHEIYDILDSKVLVRAIPKGYGTQKIMHKKQADFLRALDCQTKTKKQKKTNSLSVCNANDEHEVPHHALSPPHRDFGKSKPHILSSIRRLRGVRLVC